MVVLITLSPGILKNLVMDICKNQAEQQLDSKCALFMQFQYL